MGMYIAAGKTTALVPIASLKSIGPADVKSHILYVTSLGGRLAEEDDGGAHGEVT